MKKLLAIALALGATTGVANATPDITYSNLNIWYAQTPGSNISSVNQAALATNPIATIKNMVYTGAFNNTTGDLSFYLGSNAKSTSIAAFLASDTTDGNKYAGGFSNGYLFGVAGLSQNISTGDFKTATLMEFTMTLASAATLTITHDDGFSIWNSTNTVDLDNQSGPTVATTAPAIDLAAGTYNLWYEESNGVPADLNLTYTVDQTTTGGTPCFGFACGGAGQTVPTGVPEPISMAILGSGLIGLGVVRRKTA